MMRFEEARLRSFENWPSPYVHPEDLARAGFFYTQQIDRVRCFECQTEICRWEEGDDPMAEHQRCGGRCRFVRKQSCGNVPIGVGASAIPFSQSRDDSGTYRLDYHADTHFISSNSSCQQLQKHLPSAARLGLLGIVVMKKPDYSDLASYEARLQTFSGWPSSFTQTKEQLSDAGFYWMGFDDQTTCYHCGGGLKNWEPQDDPWIQHAKWFSTCLYVRLVKGQEFINTVTGKNVPSLSKEISELNLPSFIKKVEPTAHHKRVFVEESVSQQCQIKIVKEQEQEASRNSMVQSIPTFDQIQKDPKFFHSDITNAHANTLATSTPSCNQQSNEKRSPNDNVRLCKICYNEELGVAFLPCGHIVACIHCSPRITTCALCREPVSFTVRVFFS